MLLKEIIAQIDAEIALLQRAAQILTDAPVESKKTPGSKAKKKTVPRKKRERVAVAAAPSATVSHGRETVAAPSPQPNAEPQIQRLPPKRRIERRQLQRSGSADKTGKSPAALSGLVPFGPVAVSADEARKVQERSAQTPSTPVESEIRPAIGSERSLASLVQAFERISGLSGTGTP